MQNKSIDPSRIAFHCERAFGAPSKIERVEFLSGGAHPRTLRFSFADESFVFRCYRGNTELCRKEACLYALLENKVPVQDLVYSDFEEAVAIFRYAPGRIRDITESCV